MNTQNEMNGLQEKVKSNGKWAASEAKDFAKDTAIEAKDVTKNLSARGSELLEKIQDGISELLKSGGKSAQTAGQSALDLAKKYPVQTAVGGIVVGLYLGAKIFGSRRAK